VSLGTAVSTGKWIAFPYSYTYSYTFTFTPPLSTFFVNANVNRFAGYGYVNGRKADGA
jgi:hypothetical protein